MSPFDAATILDVSINISKDELKTKFRKLAMIHHPDKNNAPDAATKFMLIKEAYDFLKDYDASPTINAGDFIQQSYDESFGVYTINNTTGTGGFSFTYYNYQ